MQTAIALQFLLLQINAIKICALRDLKIELKIFLFIFIDSVFKS